MIKSPLWCNSHVISHYRITVFSVHFVFNNNHVFIKHFKLHAVNRLSALWSVHSYKKASKTIFWHILASRFMEPTSALQSVFWHRCRVDTLPSVVCHILVIFVPTRLRFLWFPSAQYTIYKI